MPKGGKKQNSAVEPMPSLVFNNLQTEKEMPAKTRQPKTASTSSEILLKKTRQQYKAKSWFILVVAGLAAIICILWGYALWQRMANFNFSKTDENKIWQNTKDSWERAFSATENTELEKELTKIQLKNILSQIINSEKNPPASSGKIIITASSTANQ